MLQKDTFKKDSWIKLLLQILVYKIEINIVLIWFCSYSYCRVQLFVNTNQRPSWLYGCWIYMYNYIYNLSPLKLWVWIMLMMRCTWHKIMWSSLSVTCGRPVVFSRFLHQ
jgi:hypothetical protein